MILSVTPRENAHKKKAEKQTQNHADRPKTETKKFSNCNKPGLVHEIKPLLVFWLLEKTRHSNRPTYF